MTAAETAQPTESVPFVALSRQHAALAGELRAAFERVLGTDAFILGAEVDAFEREFAESCETRYAIGVASGTAALELALTAAGIGHGDEVIVPAHTFIATPLAVLHAGATPVFCDVERDTGLIDPASAESVITKHTAAIIPVHLYGQACDMHAISELAKHHKLFVLEDAAQAHGASHGERRVGSLGSASAFSFYPSKNLGALGDGGAVCTDDPRLAESIRELRDLGQREKGNHVRVGRNERLDGMQAAFLRVKLPHLKAWNLARRENAAYLREHLPSTLTFLAEREESPCIYHLFPIRHASRDHLAELLRDEGVQVGLHYSPAVHRHPAIAMLPDGQPHGELQEAEGWASEELSLPMFPELTDREMDQVSECCRRALDEVGAAHA